MMHVHLWKSLSASIASLVVLLVPACDAPPRNARQAQQHFAGEDHPAWLAISAENKARYRMGLFNNSARLTFTADYPTPFDEEFPQHLIVQEGAFEVEARGPTITQCNGLERLSSAPEIRGRAPSGMFFTERDEQYVTAAGAFVRCVQQLDRCLFFLSEGEFSSQITIDREDLCEWDRLDRALRADMNSWFEQGTGDTH